MGQVRGYRTARWTWKPPHSALCRTYRARTASVTMSARSARCCRCTGPATLRPGAPPLTTPFCCYTVPIPLSNRRGSRFLRVCAPEGHMVTPSHCMRFIVPPHPHSLHSVLIAPEVFLSYSYACIISSATACASSQGFPRNQFIWADVVAFLWMTFALHHKINSKWHGADPMCSNDMQGGLQPDHRRDCGGLCARVRGVPQRGLCEAAGARAAPQQGQHAGLRRMGPQPAHRACPSPRRPCTGHPAISSHNESQPMMHAAHDARDKVHRSRRAGRQN